jgi:hypothetical protein
MTCCPARKKRPACAGRERLDLKLELVWVDFPGLALDPGQNQSEDHERQRDRGKRDGDIDGHVCSPPNDRRIIAKPSQDALTQVKRPARSVQSCNGVIPV